MNILLDKEYITKSGKKKTIKGVAAIKDGRLFINTNLLGRSAILCAMADGTEMLIWKDKRKDQVGINSEWLLSYADELSDKEYSANIKEFISKTREAHKEHLLIA